ncbi:invasion associated locus B family protein [Chelativorans intermedius]|nr:invasion associated locus B family protein [Chelativorans intermedius]
MIRQARAPAPHLALACLLLAGGFPAAGQEAPGRDVFIKPSEVVVPQGIELGKYRRVIQPFENWELICDENLQEMQKICNISQSFVDNNGEMVFSWSMAADADGRPFMILRTPPEVGGDGEISLSFPGREKPVKIRLEGCNEAVCVGYVPVGPILREEIGKEASVHIAYPAPAGASVHIEAPLKGLATALSAID